MTDYGRVMLEAGIFLTILSLLTLPLQETSSATYVVNVIALIVSLLIVIEAVVYIRKSSKPVKLEAK